MTSIAIITVSDSCYAGDAVDKSGPALAEKIKNGILGEATIVGAYLVPDDLEIIKAKLRECCDKGAVNLVLTTGGTGLSPRDVTPEATEAVLSKVVPGLQTLVLLEGLNHTKLAALSRGCVGFRNNTLIANLPGSVKGALEALDALVPVIPHALDLILDRKDAQKITHNILSKLESKVKISEDEEERVRTSQYPMIQMSNLLQILMSHISPLSSVNLSAESAMAQIVADPIFSYVDIPALPVSLKDGYAARSTKKSTIYEVVGECKPGEQCCFQLEKGQAIAVSTGSCVPLTADYVVPVEKSEFYDLDQFELDIDSSSTEIRPAASDVSRFQMVFDKGTIIGPAEIATLVAIDCLTVTVYRKPKIAVMSSGNELLEAWAPTKEFLKVRDSNRPLLHNLLRSWGFQTVDLGIVKDEPQAILESLIKGFDEADVVVSSGGMSMGVRDLIKNVLVEDLGAKILFGRLSMKPGKPTGFAALRHKGVRKYWFGLPGNPASAFVTSHLVLLPGLRIMAGNPNTSLLSLQAELSSDVAPDPERVEFLRGIFYSENGVSKVKLTKKDGQQSSSIVGCSGANCLIEIPPNKDILKAATPVTIHLLP